MDTMTDLMGGRIDVMYDPVSTPRVKAGDLKGLATTGARRNPELPDLPTLKELGFQTAAPSWFGLFAPKGTPLPIVNKMAENVQRVLQTPQARDQLQLSAMYPDYEGPQDFAKRVHSDSEMLRDFIKKEDIKPD